jgi:hypothetical protein
VELGGSRITGALSPLLGVRYGLNTPVDDTKRYRPESLSRAAD